MNAIDFALQIINTPAVGARSGSTDELAALGLDGTSGWPNRPMIRAKPVLRTRKTKNMLDGRGLLMEVNL